MRIADKTAFFSELKKLCKPDMGLIPKSCIVKAFDNVSFDTSSARLIDANKLRSEAETCLETTEGFQQLIDEQPTVKFKKGLTT